MSTEYRDWQPGDGLHCAYSKRAPREVPCGRPIKTAVSAQTNVIGKGDRTIVKALCANHSPGGILPSVITIEARKIATERLCSEQWKKFEKYYKEAIESLTAERNGRPG